MVFHVVFEHSELLVILVDLRETALRDLRIERLRVSGLPWLQQGCDVRAAGVVPAPVSELLVVDRPVAELHVSVALSIDVAVDIYRCVLTVLQLVYN